MNEPTAQTPNRWDADTYADDFRFVADMASGVVEWLAPTAAERVLDVGCGDGPLFDALRADGALVVGADASSAMVDAARRAHPDVEVHHRDARRLDGLHGFDAVFSNATLHWVQDADGAARSIRSTLKRGGRFVAEFGGAGCVATICTAVSRALERRGLPTEPDLGWYFPTVATYVAVLDRAAFDVTRAARFERPTPLSGGRAGLAGWLRMFGTRWWPTLRGEDDVNALIGEVEDRCRDALFDGASWTADYVRIRVACVAT